MKHTTLAVICALLIGAPAQAFDVVVVTEILPKGVAGFEAGEKSRQTVTLDFEKGTHSTKLSTGTTVLGPVEIESVRNEFNVAVHTIDATSASLSMKGQTASGVLFMPDIDYNLNIIIDRVGKSATVTGCHDGFPTYKVIVNGREIYRHEQEANPGALFGTCDIKVDAGKKSY